MGEAETAAAEGEKRLMGVEEVLVYGCRGRWVDNKTWIEVEGEI